MKPFSFLSIAFAMFAGSSAYAEDVTVCGQTVSAGILSGDLDCSSAGCAVFIPDGGTLDLAGYTITVSEDCGVICQGSCSVNGNGGQIVGSPASFGIRSVDKRSEVSVSGLHIAIVPPGVVADPPIMTNYGVYAEGSAVIDDCTFSGCGYGALARRSLEVRNSAFDGNGAAMHSDRNLVLENTTITDGNTGPEAVRRLDATNVTVTGNGYWGLFGRRVRATNSTITGNGGNVECVPTSFGCVDILSKGRPSLGLVACDTSGRIDRHLNSTGTSWGLCSLD